MNTTSSTHVAKDRLIKDFHNVITDAEELLKATATQTSERASTSKRACATKERRAPRHALEAVPYRSGRVAAHALAVAVRGTGNIGVR